MTLAHSVVPKLARGINDSGQIVGYSTTASGASHAFLWTGGTMTDMNTLIGPASGWTLTGAAAINNNGQILCGGSNTSGQWATLLYSGGSLTTLGTLGGTSDVHAAEAMNASGQVVGEVITSGGWGRLPFAPLME